jgi:hypothetical protein
MQIPRITEEHAASFRGQWLYNGKIAVAIDDVSLQFASDFANVVLNTVFGQYMAEQEAQAKKLVVAED